MPKIIDTVENFMIDDSSENINNKYDYRNELEEIRDKLNVAMENSLKENGGFVNNEVFELQKAFDKKVLNYYQDR